MKRESISAAILALALAGILCAAGCVGGHNAVVRDTQVIADDLAGRDLLAAGDRWPSLEPAAAEAPAELRNHRRTDFLPIPQASDAVADGPRFFLLNDPRTGEFWILETGGLTGAEVAWYGPLVLVRDGRLYPRHALPFEPR